MRKTGIWILLIFAGIPFLSFAQVIPDENQLIEGLIEDIASSAEEDVDYSTLYDDLHHYLSNPLNLNTATEKDLGKLIILNDFQINSILHYRDKYGDLLTIYELQVIPGMDRETIDKILPFVSVKPQEADQDISLRNAYRYGNNQMFLRWQQVLEEQKGYAIATDSTGYTGSQAKLYTRYKYSFKDDIYAGFTMEKDPGEEFFKGSNRAGFDYYSAHMQINNLSFFKTIVLGDFQAQFGQGLVMWSGFSIGKSSYALSIKKNAQELSKYSSTDENRFMRGADTIVSFGDLDMSLFYSRKPIDGNIIEQDSTNGEVISVSSLQSSGYHAQESEIFDEDALKERIAGINVNYRFHRFKIGGTFAHSAFDAALIKDTTARDLFDFRGKENYNAGLHYEWTFKDFHFFGEQAISKNGGKAFVNGVLIHMSSRIMLSALYRNYQKDYQTLYGTGFSEGPGAVNEKGFYLGTEFFPVKDWKVSAYFDTYKFPWMTYRTNAPSNGYDYFVQAAFSPSRKVDMYWRFKNEIKGVNDPVETEGIPGLTESKKQNFRYHLSYRISEQILLRNRLELTRFDTEAEKAEKGYMIYQDIKYKMKKMPFSLAFRYAVFNTDSYAARIYAYEDDILYAFSIPAYYSKGIRTYLNLQYTLMDRLDLYFKIAATVYEDKDVIGSGLNEINGNTKTDAKFQLRYKF